MNYFKTKNTTKQSNTMKEKFKLKQYIIVFVKIKETNYLNSKNFTKESNT